MGFFDSPREREAKTMYGSHIGAYDQELRGFDDLLNQIGSINTSRVRDIYGAGKRGLATRLGQARSAAGFRQSGSDATPEATFMPIEGQFASGFADLEQGQARDTLNTLFQQIQLGLQGRQAKAGVLGQKGGAIGGYLGSLSGASSLDDLLALFSTGSKFLPQGGG